MKHQVESKNLKDFYQRLKEDGMEYYSLTLFYKNIPVISTCNNQNWLDFYSQNFDIDHCPPVQQYILSSKLNFIMWEGFTIDSSTCDYINLRNKVVGVKNNITILTRKKNTTKCITFGTSKDSNHLLDFIRNGMVAKYL